MAGYSWDFGDNNGTSISQSPSHTYNASGEYTVSLTVTDDQGSTNTFSKQVVVSDGIEPPVADIVLTGTRSGNLRQITLNWNGTTVVNVDVYVNDNFNNTTTNNGSISYRVNKNGTYRFVICEEGSATTCSNEITL